MPVRGAQQDREVTSDGADPALCPQLLLELLRFCADENQAVGDGAPVNQGLSLNQRSREFCLADSGAVRAPVKFRNGVTAEDSPEGMVGRDAPVSVGGGSPGSCDRVLPLAGDVTGEHVHLRDAGQVTEDSRVCGGQSAFDVDDVVGLVRRRGVPDGLHVDGAHLKPVVCRESVNNNWSDV